MDKLKFRNEWRLARSGCGSNDLVKDLLVLRNTHNDASNYIFKELVKNLKFRKAVKIDSLNRSIVTFGRLTPVFSIRNRVTNFVSFS